MTVGNTRKPGKKPNSLERYRSEAKGEPFVLWLDDENTLEFPRPTGNQMLDVEDVLQNGTGRELLAALCGDKFDQLIEVVGDDDADVLAAIVSDMQKHFGLGN